MKIVHSTLILLIIVYAFALHAMDDKSLPAGFNVQAKSAVKQPDSKVRAEKLKELEANLNLLNAQRSKFIQPKTRSRMRSFDIEAQKKDWNAKKKLYKDAIEFGIHPDEIPIGGLLEDPLQSALSYHDEDFARLLIENGADVNRSMQCGKPIENVTSIALAWSMILHKLNTKNALLSPALPENPKLALLYYCYGANPNVVEGGYTGLTCLLAHQHFGSLDNRIELAKILIKLGVPLLATVTDGAHVPIDYSQLLLQLPRQDQLKMREVIEKAIQTKATLHAERQAGLPAILAHHMRHGARDIDKLILSYDDQNYPIGLEDEFDAVKAEANLPIKDVSRTDKGDEKS